MDTKAFALRLIFLTLILPYPTKCKDIATMDLLHNKQSEIQSNIIQPSDVLLDDDGAEIQNDGRNLPPDYTLYDAVLVDLRQKQRSKNKKRLRPVVKFDNMQFDQPHAVAYDDPHYFSTKRHFMREVYKILSRLPHNVTCSMITRLSRHLNVSYRVHYDKLNLHKHRKYSCALDVSPRQATVHEMHRIFVHLYNLLPLSMQCHVITRVAQKMQRIQGNDCEELRDAETSSLHTLTYLITSVEQDMQFLFDVMPVAKQCKNLMFRHKDVYTDTVRFVFPKQRSENRELEEKLAVVVPKVLLKYYTENKIKLPEMDSYWKKRTLSSFYVKTHPSLYKRRFTVRLNAFYLHHNEKAQSGHNIMAAVYYYGLDNLKRELFNTNFHITLEQKKRHEYFRDQRFRTYLSPYFNYLSTCEQCLILRSMSDYSNVGLAETITSLHTDKKIETTHCYGVGIPTDKPTTLTLATKTPELSKAQPMLVEYARGEKESEFVEQLTQVEIVLVIALAFVVIFCFIFMATLYTFVKRRRRQRREIYRQDMDETNTLSTDSNNDYDEQHFDVKRHDVTKHNDVTRYDNTTRRGSRNDYTTLPVKYRDDVTNKLYNKVTDFKSDVIHKGHAVVDIPCNEVRESPKCMNYQNLSRLQSYISNNSNSKICESSETIASTKSYDRKRYANFSLNNSWKDSVRFLKRETNL